MLGMRTPPIIMHTSSSWYNMLQSDTQEQIVVHTLHLDAGSVRNESEVLKQSRFDLVQVINCVLVGHVGWTDVQFEIRTKVLKIVVVREFWVSINTHK